MPILDIGGITLFRSAHEGPTENERFDMKKYLTITIVALALALPRPTLGYIILPGSATIFVEQVLNYSSDASYLKEALFNGRTKDWSRAYAKSANNVRDKLTFELLYDTHTRVPDNLTDANLEVLANGSRLKSKLTSVCKAVAIAELRVLEQYPPTQVPALYEAMTQPWYVDGAMPWGAYSTTWASESYWVDYQAAEKACLARRSVVLKLLADHGYVDIPTYAIAYFEWSDAPSVIINLNFPRWITADLKELKRLADLGNQYYSAWAQSELDILMPPKTK